MSYKHQAPNGAREPVSTRSGRDGIMRTCLFDPVATALGTDTLSDLNMLNHGHNDRLRARFFLNEALQLQAHVLFQQ